ncbi:MAG TPA: hypothetical protein VLV86_06970, partial [Vicinamibacterales bacterium]|nr:hypothetical protein [Vicinamibacterales bacterium]
DATPASVRVAGNQPTRVTLHLGLPRLTDTVTVAGSVDTPPAEATVQADVITPDGSADDQILQNTIDALAGVGNVVRVDGLSSGGLPPAATIQQIRIRQNSFDAEYHEATAAFVEIITNAKPQPWQVSLTTWDRPESAQARNAFAVGAPASQRGGANFNGTGNILNRASVNFFGNVNDGKEDQPIYAQTVSGPVRGLVDNSNRYEYGTLRVGLDNWRRNDLRFESDFQQFQTLNVGAGGFNLPERGYLREQALVRARTFWTKPLRRGGSQILRVQVQRRSETDTPNSTDPAIIVLNAFSSGGAQYQGTRVDTQTEISDVVTLPMGPKQVLRGGLTLWHVGVDSSLTSNAGGTFTFSSLDAYVAGQPTTYTQRVGAGVCCFGVTQLSLWAEDDIALAKTLSLSLGLRQESETRTSRATNLGPRGQIDWSPTGVPHTTFHLGAGVFHVWLQPNDIEQTVRVDGIHQQDVLIVNPAYPLPEAAAGGAALPSGRYLLSPDLTLPTIVRSSIGVDHTRGPFTFHADFAHQTGQQFRGDNLNAPVDGGRPDPNFGNIVAVESNGRARLDALTTSVSYNDQKRGTFLRFNYTFAHAEDNTDGAFFLPVSPLQPDAEWGPGSNDAHHRFGGNFTQPLFNRRIGLSTYWQFASALPYTITTGIDTNGDGIFNERPDGVSRNSARGFAQFYQGAHVGWNLPKGVAPPGTPAKYRMQIWVEADNLFNRVNRTAISGVLTSPYFGQAIAASQPRRLYFGISATL